MYNLKTLLEQELIRSYNIKFDVIKKQAQDESFLITPTNSDKEFFDINVTVRNGIRIIITCEPSILAGEFLKHISEANQEKKELFIEYWKQIADAGNNKIQVFLNNTEINQTELINSTNNWKNFKIILTRVPFDEDEKTLEEVVSKYVVLICGMLLCLTDRIMPEEELIFDSEISETEGNKIRITVNKYERSRLNRTLCLNAKGYSCNICGFNFEETYGEIGKNFIEVHHIIPVSMLGDDYKLDPLKDLIPLCPNCHSMIHKKNPPYTPDELKNMLVKII